MRLENVYGSGGSPSIGWRCLRCRGQSNIASVVALIPERFSATYSATKAYVLSLAQSLDAELQGRGVKSRPFCLALPALRSGSVPGWMQWPFQQRW